MTEEEDAVVGGSQLWQNSIEQLKLPRSPIKLSSVKRKGWIININKATFAHAISSTDGILISMHSLLLAYRLLSRTFGMDCRKRTMCGFFSDIRVPRDYFPKPYTNPRKGKAPT